VRQSKSLRNVFETRVDPWTSGAGGEGYYVDARPLRTSFLARTAWQVDPTDFSCVLLGVPNYPYDTLRHQPTYLPTLIPTDLRTFTSHHSSYSIEGADIEMRDAETSRWGMEKVKEVALYIYSINVLIVRPGMIH
jgi:hypothetical protein